MAHYQVFLSYSRNDDDAATHLVSQLDKAGLSCFRDQDSIREGEAWLQKLQDAVDDCGSFVLLVGQDGVRRWMAAETEVALMRHIDPHDVGKPLPIFPILLGDRKPEDLSAFLRRFQATRWNGTGALPLRLIEQIKNRTPARDDEGRFEGCPFVGLGAFQPNQAHLFFGRQKETLDALACFDTHSHGRTVKWLEISGNSGSGKSSLMNAGMLPLIEQGWLYGRTRIGNWRVIGPMMPGEHPVAMLAESLARFSRDVLNEPLEMADIRRTLEADDRGLADWLRGRKQEDTAFLLAIDQFEELFTFAEQTERAAFDGLLASALADAECPLFVLSTVRADFVNQYDAKLPRLQDVRNRFGTSWSLPLISGDGLREVITGPAALAGLDVSEVREAMIAEAGHEPGALPLVENALNWLWNERENGKLSGRKFNENGGLAGILARNADALLDSLGTQKAKALELLFQLVNVDPVGLQHTRRRLPIDEALAIAGGGETGQALIDRLAGRQARDGQRIHTPLRLITVDEESVNLIHETLIRTKGLDAEGEPDPHWPALWKYVNADKQKNRARYRDQLRHQSDDWSRRGRFGRWLHAASWKELRQFGALAQTAKESSYIRWSRFFLLGNPLSIILLVSALAAPSIWLYAYKLPAFSYWSYVWPFWLGYPPLPEMVDVPAGSFKMGRNPTVGDDDERPEVRLDAFQMGRYEVTFAEYDFFVLDERPQKKGADRLAFPPAGPQGEDWGRDDRPVIYVNWTDAYAYTEWLTEQLDHDGVECRLPTEQEWEYAARAGTDKEYGIPKETNGSDDITGKGLANCIDCGGKWDGLRRTSPVGWYKQPNPWDLHDMHGNVWEWCLNEYHDPEQIGPGGDAPRAWRGGSWLDDPENARASLRNWFNPGFRGQPHRLSGDVFVPHVTLTTGSLVTDH